MERFARTNHSRAFSAGELCVDSGMTWTDDVSTYCRVISNLSRALLLECCLAQLQITHIFGRTVDLMDIMSLSTLMSDLRTFSPGLQLEIMCPMGTVQLGVHETLKRAFEKGMVDAAGIREEVILTLSIRGLIVREWNSRAINPVINLIRRLVDDRVEGIIG